MKPIVIFLLICSSFWCFSQTKISGVVKDKKGTPIFAANVYLKKHHRNGSLTDFDGKFSIQAIDEQDTLIISYIGFETRKIALVNIPSDKALSIVLDAKSLSLAEVVITAKDPISEKFAVTKMKMLQDVYLNPVSQGDPLKAITILPVSTNVDETANPSLRGSSPSRSRVVLNGVPVYKPVRASNISNQGFFSLFNPEIIDKQYVYASNPPLTHGNTSAGLLEIQTIKELKSNQLQVSASLASVGLFLSQNIKKDTSFVQIYGNYQFSDAFVGIQKNQFPDIKNFNTLDAGINFHTKTGKNAEFNSFNYFIDESFKGYNQSFTYKGNVSSLNKRIFTVNNFKYYFEKGILSVNSGTNKAVQTFRFGNINSEQNTSQVYTSVDYKLHLLSNTNIQFGISHDFHQNKYKDSIPSRYYALSPNSSNYFVKTSIHKHILEAYLYTNWDINEKFTFSSGIRSNLPAEGQKQYFSSQMGLKYRLNTKQSFLLNGGKYHNYSLPDYYSKTYDLLSAYQIALDYEYRLKTTLLKLAAYFKNETGKQALTSFFETEKINTMGLELYLEQYVYTYFKIFLTNAFIDQKMSIDNKNYSGAMDFNYFLKASVQYNNSKLFSLSLSYMSRPGISYNEITASRFDERSKFYEPVFSDDLYGSRFRNYHRFDLSLSKYIKLNNNALIIFLSLNNLFDCKNEKSALYNSDYSSKYFDFYQFRTIYFGMVWQLNY